MSLLYTSNGGIASFGIPSDAPGHSEAMNAAFAGVVYVAAGLSALTAIIGMLFLRK
ncbi:hypothetical protein [Sulfitobacter aestuariivivens]|uniref:hypothetical protein n=1 Tax=Sulfitobacter aestuariivivens TaxID=2766981 RepID=UPI0036207E78